MPGRYQPPNPSPILLERLRRDAAALWGDEIARLLDELLIEAATELTVVESAVVDPVVDWPELEPPCQT